MAEILCERDLPDFLVDGFIAHSLGPKHAEEYLSRFLKCLAEEPNSRLVPFTRGWLVERPSMTDAAPTTTQRSDHKSKSKSKGRKTKRRARVLLPQAERLVEMQPRLFDRQVDTALGTVVPQTTWIGISSQTGVQSPIFFIFPNGSLGIPYDHLSWRYSLQYATAEVPRMLKRCNLNVRMRIKWPGYKVFYYEFRIYDTRVGQKVPITISRLVERVARGIHHLFLDAEPDPHEFDERWKLGGENGIQLSDITIIGLLHISKGAWLPILQLNRHIVVRTP